MANKITALRGMKDILPEETIKWQWLETILKSVMHNYCYSEIRTPILESTQLFARSIGATSDIVSKEMYTFADRNGESLTLRPEGTAGVVRAVNEHNLTYDAPQKLYYFGNMYRYERPQKGRYRQFHQFGVEVLGLDSPALDAEVILLGKQIWQKLGISDALQLELNTLGDFDDRQNYRQALFEYLIKYESDLDADSKMRLHVNPLRILDSKDENTQKILQNAPLLVDYLGVNAKAHFEKLCEILQSTNVAYKINPKLVRGLDYYNRSVFEWTTTKLGAQNAVMGGGRYDGLIEQLGGKPTPAVGFAMGMERLLLLLETLEKFQMPETKKVVLLSNETHMAKTMQLAENLRTLATNYNLDIIMAGSIKSQFKKADKYGADVVLLYADDEVAKNVVTCKHMREQNAKQLTLQLQEINDYLTKYFGA